MCASIEKFVLYVCFILYVNYGLVLFVHIPLDKYMLRCLGFFRSHITRSEYQRGAFRAKKKI